MSKHKASQPEDWRRRSVQAFLIDFDRKHPGVPTKDVAACLAEAGDKAWVYILRGEPVPGDLKDEKATGLAFAPTPKLN